jgi:hypothetical protein
MCCIAQLITNTHTSTPSGVSTWRSEFSSPNKESIEGKRTSVYYNICSKHNKKRDIASPFDCSGSKRRKRNVHSRKELAIVKLLFMLTPLNSMLFNI